MNKAPLVIAIVMSFAVTTATVVRSDEKQPVSTDDKDLAADLKLLQGSWEQTFGNDGTGKPTIRLVKTIDGNTETRREYPRYLGRNHHSGGVDRVNSLCEQEMIFPTLRLPVPNPATNSPAPALVAGFFIRGRMGGSR